MNTQAKSVEPNFLIKFMLSCLFVNLLITFCPTYRIEPVNKEFLDVYNISRYYTPIPGQKSYYLNRSYEEDLAMNTSGDPFTTADGYVLSEKDTHRVVACPPNFKMGTKLFIEWIGNVVCHDRGWAIKNKRIDLWAGIGDEGKNNIYRYAREYAWPHRVYLVK